MPQQLPRARHAQQPPPRTCACASQLLWRRDSRAAGRRGRCLAFLLVPAPRTKFRTQTTAIRDPKVFSDPSGQWGIVHFSAVSSRFIWIFHTFQDQNTCAAPQLPAPCTGCLVHASAMTMPEWRRWSGTPMPTPRGRPCSGNVPGPRRGVRAALLTTATTAGPHTCQRSSGSVSEKKHTEPIDNISSNLYVEKKQFPYVLLNARAHPY